MTSQAMETLRIIKDAFGTVFKIKKDDSRCSSADNSQSGNIPLVDDQNHQENESDADDESNRGVIDSMNSGQSGAVRNSRKFTDETGTILLSCLGTGYVNMSRKIR